MELVNRTLYIDANRRQSVSNSDDNSSWEYKLNNGVRLPAGTQISMLQCYLNYNGINGGSIEITDDIAEEISYSFVKPQGSTFSLTAELLNDSNAGETSVDNSTGVFSYDALKHRNIQNNTKSPLLRIDGGYTSIDPSDELYYIEARLAEYDISQNFTLPFVLDEQQPEEVYEEYYDNGIESVVNGENYWGAGPPFTPNGQIIELTLQDGGIGYSVGDLVTFSGGGGTGAKAFISKVEAGIIQAVRIIQPGDGYTSDPTITISGAGTGAVINITRGNLFSTRTNNSGYGALVGCQLVLNGSFYEVTPARIFKAGIGYRKGDILYVDQRLAPGNDFPQDHQIPNDDFQTQATVTINYTTALDFQSPGVMTLSTDEKIFYARATQNPTSIIFVADDSDKADTETINTTNGVNAHILGKGATSYQNVYRRFSYNITTDAAGSNYRSLPEVVYSSTGYEEEHLNTEDGEPVLLPIMNNTHGLDRVVYLGGCRDNLSASNYLQEYLIASKNPTSEVAPGVITVTGGLPDTRGGVDIIPEQAESVSGTNYTRYVRPPILDRIYQQESGLKLGYSVVIISQGAGGYADGAELPLTPEDPDTQNGTGGKITIRTGYNVSPAHVLCAEVTTSGTRYKKHERYYIDDGRDPADMCLVEILDLNPITNLSLPAQTGRFSSVYFTLNTMTNGICDNLKNNIIQSTIFKGKSSTLQGDQFYNNSGVRDGLYNDLADGSLPPRYGYNQSNTLDFDNLQTCGGTEDLVGYCEFTEKGYLIPKVETATLTISKGIYSVEELGKIISDQLTNSDKKSGFLNTSSFSKLVETHSYEAALFTGKQHNKAGRGVFVSMDVFNQLMELYRDLDPNLDITTNPEFLWDNFHQTHYYSFVKSFLPKAKPVIRQVPSRLQFDSNPPGGAVLLNEESYFITTQYDQMNDGFLIGTTDFVFKYDTDKSTYSMEFLHSPFRVPQYDKFGNQYSSPGTVGAIVKKSCKNPLIEGIRKQFLRNDGFTAKISEAVLDSIEQPITRTNGVMIHNFSLNVSSQSKTFQQNKYGRFSDFFDTAEIASDKWRDTLFSRLGFTYNQLNENSFKESVTYYNQPATVCYGITTNQSLDTSTVTSISTLTADKIRATSADSGSGAELPYQQLFNMTLPNRPLTSVFTTQKYSTINVATFTKTTKSTLFYTGSLYDATIGLFIQTDGDDLTGLNLPILIKDGYFIISSNVIDGYRDSIKKNENIPLLGVVPKNSWQSQDYSAVLSSEIVHITSNDKVINSVKIDIYNPDLTRPILRPDSTVMLRITLPPEAVQSPEDSKKSKD